MMTETHLTDMRRLLTAIETLAALSLLQGDIVRGAILLDFIRLQHGGFQRRAGLRHLQFGSLTEHLQGMFRLGSFLSKITVNALLQGRRFADIKQIVI